MVTRLSNADIRYRWLWDHPIAVAVVLLCAGGAVGALLTWSILR
jgi:hypothetical protein